MNLLKAIGYTLWKWFVVLVLFLVIAFTITVSLTWALEGIEHLFGKKCYWRRCSRSNRSLFNNCIYCGSYGGVRREVQGGLVYEA